MKRELCWKAFFSRLFNCEFSLYIHLTFPYFEWKTWTLMKFNHFSKIKCYSSRFHTFLVLWVYAIKRAMLFSFSLSPLCLYPTLPTKLFVTLKCHASTSKKVGAERERDIWRAVRYSWCSYIYHLERRKKVCVGWVAAFLNKVKLLIDSQPQCRHSESHVSRFQTLENQVSFC